MRTRCLPDSREWLATHQTPRAPPPDNIKRQPKQPTRRAIVKGNLNTLGSRQRSCNMGTWCESHGTDANKTKIQKPRRANKLPSHLLGHPGLSCVSGSSRLNSGFVNGHFHEPCSTLSFQTAGSQGVQARWIKGQEAPQGGD